MADSDDMDDLLGPTPGEAIERAAPSVTLDKLVGEFLQAATFDVRELFDANGGFKPVRDVPRPLTLLIKGVKMKRLMPVEWADALGTPASEVVEMKWESQAALLLRAIELVTNLIERRKKAGDPMTDEEVEQGAIDFVIARHPELAEILKAKK